MPNYHGDQIELKLQKGDLMKKYLIILGLSTYFVQVFPGTQEVPADVLDQLITFQSLCQYLSAEITTAPGENTRNQLMAYGVQVVHTYFVTLKNALTNYPANSLTSPTTLTKFISDPHFSSKHINALVNASNLAQQNYANQNGLQYTNQNELK